MPYISKDRRKAIWGESTTDYDCIVNSAGELNYKLTCEILDYVKTKGCSYQTFNDIVGALDNCKDEFRRRIQHSYEDKKMKDNGDVYKEELKGAHILKLK